MKETRAVLLLPAIIEVEPVRIAMKDRSEEHVSIMDALMVA